LAPKVSHASASSTQPKGRRDQSSEALAGVLEALAAGDAKGAADAALRANLSDWCVRESWFDTAAADCKFMHCLPVRRNVAVADDILDGPRSIVLQEAYNRLPAQMAVLHRLLSTGVSQR
jgi:ornithine carbamoyltransferase